MPRAGRAAQIEQNIKEEKPGCAARPVLTAMAVFTYGEKEILYLKSRDKRLGAAIDRIGPVRREVTPDVFDALVSSILSQQISGRAAETVYARLTALAGGITPGSLGQLAPEHIQACGMSLRKAKYIAGAAEAARSGAVDFSALASMPDGEVVRTLTGLRGVGEWTAEMLLIFSLCRPDVLSYGDFGIRKGIMRLYGHRELPRERFERYRRRYSPYGTVASLYLWEIAAGR